MDETQKAVRSIRTDILSMNAVEDEWIQNGQVVLGRKLLSFLGKASSSSS